MTTIWIDPPELETTALALGEQAMRVQETMTGTRTSCTCEVPRSLVGWLDEELQAITVMALLVAVGYLQEAADIKHRAVQLAAEQSLATTQGVVPSGLDIAAMVAQGVPGGLALVIGGDTSIVGSGPSTGGTPLVIGGGPTLATGGGSWYDVDAAILGAGSGGRGGGGGPTGGGGPDLTDFFRGTGDIAASHMTPFGTSANNGKLVDWGGNEATSTYSGVVNTYTGRPRF